MDFSSACAELAFRESQIYRHRAVSTAAARSTLASSATAVANHSITPFAWVKDSRTVLGLWGLGLRKPDLDQKLTFQLDRFLKAGQLH